MLKSIGFCFIKKSFILLDLFLKNKADDNTH
jgi:hypothetical protein